MVSALFLILLTICIGKYFCDRPEYAIPTGVFCNILFWYFIGLAGGWNGRIYFQLLGCAVMLFLIIRRFSIYHKAKSWILTLLLLGGCLGLSCWMYHTHAVIIDSDYNYWGTAAKYIYLTNTFDGLKGVVYGFAKYTPLMEVLYHWVFTCLGGLKEWYMYVAYVMFVYLCELPLLKGISTESWKKTLLSVVRILIYIIFPLYFVIPFYIVDWPWM